MDAALQRPRDSVDAGARFRALVEQISAITYTWTWRDDEYFVLYTSPQIESILGYSPQEWIADPPAWYEWVHPDDRAVVIAENKRCETSAEAYSLRYRMIRKDGRVIWVEVLGSSSRTSTRANASSRESSSTSHSESSPRRKWPSSPITTS